MRLVHVITRVHTKCFVCVLIYLMFVVQFDMPSPFCVENFLLRSAWRNKSYHTLPNAVSKVLVWSTRVCFSNCRCLSSEVPVRSSNPQLQWNQHRRYALDLEDRHVVIREGASLWWVADSDSLNLIANKLRCVVALGIVLSKWLNPKHLVHILCSIGNIRLYVSMRGVCIRVIIYSRLFVNGAVHCSNIACNLIFRII